MDWSDPRRSTAGRQPAVDPTYQIAQLVARVGDLQAVSSVVTRARVYRQLAL